jgi:hypothetical protein
LKPGFQFREKAFPKQENGSNRRIEIFEILLTNQIESYFRAIKRSIYKCELNGKVKPNKHHENIFLISCPVCGYSQNGKLPSKISITLLGNIFVAFHLNGFFCVKLFGVGGLKDVKKCTWERGEKNVKR